ncbi:MAG TPA: transcriptional repressor LexA [Burkholderiales bacterium]|nr:transcriptional repressor LexA [Burkholderiales bacterium]
MEQLTRRQTQILEFIKDGIEANGYPPTLAEIAGHFGFRSITGAVGHLKALARKDALELTAGTRRGIRVKAEPGLPLIGRVAAGSPILSEANIQARYRVDPALFKPRADYLLKVRGMSMRDAGILDADLIAVHRTHEARSGQIVVARLHDEVTVKRLQRRGHHAELVAENPDFKSIVLDLRRDPLMIEGICVGVIRNGRTL